MECEAILLFSIVTHQGPSMSAEKAMLRQGVSVMPDNHIILAGSVDLLHLDWDSLSCFGCFCAFPEAQ